MANRKFNIVDKTPEKNNCFFSTTIDLLLEKDGKTKWKQKTNLVPLPELPLLNKVEFFKNNLYLVDGEIYFISASDLSSVKKPNYTGMYIDGNYGVKDGKAYVILDKVLVYDIASGTYTLKATAPSNFFRVNADTLVGNFIYSFRAGTTHSKYDVTTDTFTTFTTQQYISSPYRQIAIGKFIYILFPENKDIMYKYDTETNILEQKKFIKPTEEKGEIPTIFVQNKGLIYGANRYGAIMTFNVENQTYEFLQNPISKTIAPVVWLSFINNNEIIYVIKDNALTVPHTIYRFNIKTKTLSKLLDQKGNFNKVKDTGAELLLPVGDGKKFSINDDKETYEYDFNYKFKWKKITSTDVA